MSLQHILLGLLREPASGYDIKAYFDSSVRYFWAAELSQIYPTLQRMEKESLLRSKLQASSKGPKRRVYSLTVAGRKMLREWLLGDPHLGDERYGFVAQFFFMDAAGDWGETKRYVVALRKVFTDRLKQYKQIEREWSSGETPYPDQDSLAGFHQYMALRGGLRYTTARIEWCQEVLKRVESHMRTSTSSNHKRKKQTKQKSRRKT